MASADSRLFVKLTNRLIFAILIYFDGLIITGDNGEEIAIVKLGDLHNFLGLELEHNRQGIFLYQYRYMQVICSSGFMEVPNKSHIKVAQRILKYI